MRPQATLTPLCSAVALATLLATASANAADFKAGDWDLSVGGIVNAYYTSTNCSGSQTVTGLALATKALGCGGADGRTVIGNGLLPNALITSVKGRQEGIDIGGTLLIGAAVSSSDSISNNNNVDVRQGFFTVGTPEYGTLKIGRDQGLFGDVIFADMTLLGAGAPVAGTQANRVTLGHIGAGYTYLGYYGQIAYSLPTTGGFGLSVALMSPVNAFANPAYTGQRSPQVQAKASFAFTGGKAWLAMKSQSFKGAAPAKDFTMKGLELGGQFTLGDLGLLANVQTGTGMGVLADGDNGDHKSTAVLLQGTYKVTAKAKLGLSYGTTKLKDSTTTALKENNNTTLGLYYSLTKSVTLVGELSSTRSKSAAGETARMSGVALGGILFF